LRVAIHQPNYLPYLGFFHKIYISDVFVILDTVQFVKSGPLAWMNRNKIRTSLGWMWLTVPVLTKGKFPVIIKEALIDSTKDWRRKHFNAIYVNYHKSEYFDRYSGFLENLYKREWDSLALLNEEIIDYIIKLLEIKTKVFKASELGAKGQGSELLIDICKRVDAQEYVYGKHGEDYMELDKFEQNGIKPVLQNFSHPVYKQLYEPFVENMSILDLLFNKGSDSIDVLAEAKT
jgi:hypothetical protein